MQSKCGLFYLSLLLCLSMPLVRADVIKLASGEWPPYLSEKQPFGGFAADVVTTVFKDIDHQVLFQYYPWARAEHMVKYDQIIGSVIWSKTEERMQYAWFSEPVLTLQSVAFFSKTKPISWQTLHDFENMTIAIPLGSSLGIWQPLVDAKSIKLERVLSIENGFKLLLKGRVDILSLSKDVGYYVLRSKFNSTQINQITHSPKPLAELEYSLMLSKQNKNSQALLAEFNRQLLRMKQSGRLAIMEQKFADGYYDLPKTVIQQ